MEKMKALLASSFIAGSLAVYLATGTTDLKTLGLAGIAALAPVLMRWANPNDAAFGISK